MKHSIISLALLLIAVNAQSAKVPLEYKNKVYEEAIQTVILQKTGTEERIPLVSLSNPLAALTLKFDELRPENDYYQYKYIHCSADWNPSDIHVFDYIEGMQSENIDNYGFSQNTYFQYTNYSVTFPTEYMRPKLSGNYLLVVFRNYNEEDIILSQRFMVVNDIFKIDAKVERSSEVEYRFKKQEIDFTVTYDNYEIPNPMSDINAVILQNTNWTTANFNIKPRFINNGVLDFNYNNEVNNFWGANEFRYFDIRSLRTMSPSVNHKYIDEYNRPVAELFREKTRATDPYLEYSDYNGKIVFDNKDAGSRDPNISSDYVNVKFYYVNPGGELNNPLYIFGELTNWELKNDFKMVYDKSKNLYYCEATLKQGYYSYWYVTPSSNTLIPIDLTLTEGNFYQTENDYNILIYHKNQFLRYDELLGYTKISSAGEQK
ncbi:MAG: DUF5103 domain-containing protein [Bacteroidetes bacterium]|nr:DUF5103 domain-containing protein [Bacteroidota bacterium]